MRGRRQGGREKDSVQKRRGKGRKRRRERLLRWDIKEKNRILEKARESKSEEGIYR